MSFNIFDRGDGGKVLRSHCVFVVSFTVIDSGDCGEQQVYSEMASLDVCF